MDIIRRAADPQCSANLVDAVAFIDRVLSAPPLRSALKALFGLRDLEHDDDFVSLLSVGLSSMPLCVYEREGADDAVRWVEPDGVLAGEGVGPGGGEHRVRGVLCGAG